MSLLYKSLQWRFRDFQDLGANPKGGANLLFGQFLPKNCMKMEKLNQKGGMHPCAP